MNAAPRIALERIGRHTPHAHTTIGCSGEQLFQPVVGAIADAKFLHASRAQGLEDWIDPVDDHASASAFSSSSRNAAARSDAQKTARMPAWW